MRAVLCHSFGGTDGMRLEEVAPPAMRPGHIRLKTAAAAIAYIDSLVLGGKSHMPQKLPYSPGVEVSGTVIEVAPDVPSFRLGDRVMAVLEHASGGLCEEIVVSAGASFKVPDEMPFEIAAAFPATYRTAHSSLIDRANLRSGEWLLVLGAAGGVGLPAVEIGKILGARVIAGASTDAKLDVAKAHGADHLVNYTSEDLRARVKDITGGRGVNLLFDPVGGDLFDKALRSLAPQGRAVLVGFTSGKIPEIPAGYLSVKTLTIMGGSSETLLSPELAQERMKQLAEWYGAGQLKPKITSGLKLGDFAEAFRLLRERRSVGRIVLTID